jgi:hypothetical protein
MADGLSPRTVAAQSFGERLATMLRTSNVQDDGAILERDSEDEGACAPRCAVVPLPLSPAQAQARVRWDAARALAEEAVEASIFETLVKCIRRRGKDLKPVFERYCSLGDVLNVTQLSLPNFKKFGQEARFIVDQPSNASFDLLFSKTTRRLSGGTRDPRLSYQTFVACLARIILDRQPDLDLESVPTVVSRVFEDNIAHAERWKPLPPVEELLQPEVAGVLQRERGFLIKVRVRLSGLLRVCLSGLSWRPS